MERRIGAEIARRGVAMKRSIKDGLLRSSYGCKKKAQPISNSPTIWKLSRACEGERYGKTTRRAAFLVEMERVVPWRELCALIEPVYPKSGNGRPPVGLERMLRISCLQPWFNLSDPGAEEALYESGSMRRFAGIDLGREPV